jgi:hypothetical protein
MKQQQQQQQQQQEVLQELRKMGIFSAFEFSGMAESCLGCEDYFQLPPISSPQLTKKTKNLLVLDYCHTQ